MPASVHLQSATQIVDTLKSICDHDINYIDTQGKICASTDPSRIGDYHEGGYQAAISGEIITIEKDDPYQGIKKGINMPIRYHGDTIAVIGITGDPEEVRRYGYLAQRITRLLLREHELDVKDHNHQTEMNYIVRALINNERIHPDFLEEILKKNGIVSQNLIWQTAVFQLNRRYHLSNLSLIETDVYQAFQNIGSCLYTYCYPDEYVLLTDSENLTLHAYLFRELSERYRGILKIGVGTGETFLRQHLSYQSAKLAIQSLAPEGTLSYYEDLDLEILLAGVSNGEKDAFVKKCLSHLSADDLHLLDAYFSSEMSLQDTAGKLFLHKNTVQYRLNRIQERCGYNPRAFQDAVVLYTALKVKKERGEA